MSIAISCHQWQPFDERSSSCGVGILKVFKQQNCHWENCWKSIFRKRDMKFFFCHKMHNKLEPFEVKLIDFNFNVLFRIVYYSNYTFSTDANELGLSLKFLQFFGIHFASLNEFFQKSRCFRLSAESEKEYVRGFKLSIWIIQWAWNYFIKLYLPFFL
jgi:hypothetical protein